MVVPLSKKEIKEIEESVKASKELSKHINLVATSSTRSMILYCLKTRGSMTKMDLYNILVKKNKLIDISYINISANVDKLIKAKLIDIINSKDMQYNQKIIKVNEKNVNKHMEELVNLLKTGKKH